ncbi:MAG TPA: hypothetical protein VG077_08035 [Verrucomicrobiae bacterium]|nr:hypothetical protein [Verrucomicrobiae bacterium]
MNEPQTNTPVPDDLASQVASLRHQITHLLLVLIVISGTLATYLFYQARTFGNDLATLEPQAREVIQNYNQNLPHIQKFVQALVTYGQAHPDFQPLLKKYGLPLTLSAATNSAPKP